jgi:hypothetical protein
MDLSPFENRHVLIQLREQPFLMAAAREGKPMPMVSTQAGPNGPEPIPVHTPFIIGKVVMRHELLFVQYMDPNNVKMEVLFRPDSFFAVTAISEDRIITG